MTAIGRGAHLRYEQRPVLVLDQGPDGWWVYVEDQVDERGYPLIVQCPARDLDVVEEGLF